MGKAKTLLTTLSKRWESRHLCPIPDLGEMTLSLSPFRIMLAVGLLSIALLL